MNTVDTANLQTKKSAHGQTMNAANTANENLCSFQETSPSCEAESERGK